VAAGDLITANYQYEYSGLLMGAGTPYIVERVEGLYSLPDIRGRDSERQDEHGLYPGVDLLSGRRILIRLGFNELSATNLESLLANAGRAFRPGTVEEPFVFQRPGQGGKRFVNCKTKRKNFDQEIDWHYSRGAGRGIVELQGSDPRIYSMTLKSTQVNLAAGTSVAGDLLVENDGDFETYGTVTIGGPTVNPRIQNSADGNREIKLDITLTTEELVLDLNRKTVTVDGVDRYDVVRNDSQWWKILPGTNTIKYNRTGTVGASMMVVQHRDTWI
jgi:Phage tail protein